jgi:hypothetical protein
MPKRIKTEVEIRKSGQIGFITSAVERKVTEETFKVWGNINSAHIGSMSGGITISTGITIGATLYWFDPSD